MGQELQLSASVTPSDAKFTLKWTSGDPAVASVDSNGKVTGLSEGHIKITVEAGEKSAYCDLSVDAGYPTMSVTSDSVSYGTAGSGLATINVQFSGLESGMVYEINITDSSEGLTEAGDMNVSSTGEGHITVHGSPGGAYTTKLNLTIKKDGNIVGSKVYDTVIDLNIPSG